MTLLLGAGTLEIDVVQGNRGRTQVKRLIQAFPQRVTTPMYLDADDPGLAYLVVQNPSGGAYSDDILHTRVSAAPNSRLHLTSQAATQVYAGSGTGARHEFDFQVSESALVEHFPKTVIPHADATYRQSTMIKIEGDGSYVGWEAVAAGRIGHGERLDYRTYESRTVIECDGEIQARDVILLEPQRTDLSGPGLLADWDYCGALFVIAPGRTLGPLLQSLRTSTADLAGSSCGVTTLPGDAGIVVRVLARGAPALHDTVRALWTTVRRDLLDRGVPTERL